MNHESFMRRCFDLASKAGKEVKSNPRVGAVLVYKNRIIGEGYHKRYGDAHAEVNCINSVKKENQALIPESTLYVSLEPCCHEGKTPPCTSLIMDQGIQHVVVSVLDPSTKVHQKGVALLREHGIKVETGILAKDGKALIQNFTIRERENRPYIILKIVKSRDGYIGQKGKKIWLSNTYTSVLTHQWRSEIDAILVGTNTVINDNPSLTTRNFPGDNPLKIIVDRYHRIPLEMNVFNDHFLYCTLKFREGISKENQLILDPEQELESILQYGIKNGINKVMVEGGSEMIKSFYAKGLWDEARIVSTPIHLETGIKAVNIHGKLKKSFTIENDKIHFITKDNG